ncbi:MAG TPA: hypothetical protein DEA05_06855 [Rhodobacteraceae bacterium]|nr:hypothetical protein [Paracoccaceae bacterium]
MPEAPGPDLPGPEEVAGFFTDAGGAYAFARWGRPVAPVVFGVEDATLATVKGAFQAMAQLSGLDLAETDPELGMNCMMFFFRDWAELADLPDLDRLIPDLHPLVERLTREGANQYRLFRFDEAGAIKAAFVFLRMDESLSKMPADALALGQVAQLWLLWSATAFAERAPLARAGGTVILRPDVAAVIRAAYDPVLPAAARDASHALRLYARIAAAGGQSAPAAKNRADRGA